jgi:hypothetical protein
MPERAEKLRRRVLNRLHAFETGEREVNGRSVSGGTCKVCGPRAERILAVIVDELGVTWTLLDHIPTDYGPAINGAREMLATLLEAAGVEPDA